MPLLSSVVYGPLEEKSEPDSHKETRKWGKSVTRNKLCGECSQSVSLNLVPWKGIFTRIML